MKDGVYYLAAKNSYLFVKGNKGWWSGDTNKAAALKHYSSKHYDYWNCIDSNTVLFDSTLFLISDLIPVTKIIKNLPKDVI